MASIFFEMPEVGESGESDTFLAVMCRDGGDIEIGTVDSTSAMGDMVPSRLTEPSCSSWAWLAAEGDEAALGGEEQEEEVQAELQAGPVKQAGSQEEDGRQ